MNATDPGQVWPPKEEESAGPLTGAPCAVGEQALNIRQCPSCDGSHDGLLVKEFSRPSGPFTHWFLCPNTKEPVSISLAMLKAGEGMELSGPVCQALAEAQLSGRYMVAVWHIDHANAIQCSKHSAKFPTGDYFSQKDIKNHKGCVEMLSELLRQEIGPVQPDIMKAVNPQPLRTLMGALDPNTQKQQIKLPGHPVTVPPEGRNDNVLAETSADKAQPVG